MSLLVSEIASFLSKEFHGKDFKVQKISSISNLEDYSLSFVTKKTYLFDRTKKSLILLIDGYELENDIECSIIYSKNPRLDFIKITNLIYKKQNNKIAETVKIGNNCKIGTNVAIGEYTVIKDNVTIGEGTVINNHVVIESNTIIGKNCYIKSGAIIGEDGFGFERDEDGVPLRFPHIGNVVIGDNVEIGAKTTIAKGTLDSTIIKDNVKIDEQVHIAHNCIVNENVLLTACVEVSGSVNIGKNSWIGPNSSIKDGIKIGTNSFIGIACNVCEDLIQDSKIGSFSNLSLRHVIKLKKVLNEK